MLPGSLPRKPQLFSDTKKDSLDRLCTEYLSSRSIVPKTFVSEVRSIFRLHVELGWRACADEVIRKANGEDASNQLWKTLNLGSNYSQRLREKPLGYTYLWSWALLTNTTPGNLFPASPRSVAVHASAVTCSVIRSILNFAESQQGDEWDWKQCMSDNEVRESHEPGKASLLPGDYCLLFRTLMNTEWARAKDRSRQSLESIAKRIMEKHHMEDFQLQHALLSNVETLSGLVELLDLTPTHGF